MRILVRLLLFSFIATVGIGQEPSPESVKRVLIGKLVIDSNTLPPTERERIVRMFEHEAFLQGEIGERIRQALRNRGYFKALADEAEISSARDGGVGADVRVKVNEGRQYRLGEIRVQKATVFSSSTLRNLFHLQRGELFNAEKVGRGIEAMRELYGTRGYVNFVATPIPMIDESRGTIDLVVDVDEGKPLDFGKLYLEGIEPYTGAVQALMNSWKPFEGKRFNSAELRRWFAENRSTWRVTEYCRSAGFRPSDPEGHVVNVTLSQWDP